MNHWLDQAKKRLKADSNLTSDVLFEQLQEHGIIDERGQVTGQLHRWSAFLAITEVKRAADKPQVEVFRCLKPVFGMPGGATIDVCRDSMVGYLQAGKRVITAHLDHRLNMWKEDCDVHLSDDGFVRCSSAVGAEDNVGALPEFHQSTSGL